jgi:hypothetical protein
MTVPIPEPTRDTTGDWATPHTWVRHNHHNCACKQDNAINTPLTDRADVE